MQLKLKVIVLFYMFYLTLTNNSKTILLLGQIRSGRSCFINNFFNISKAIVGDYDGEISTLNTEYYNGLIENRVYTILDTKGFENSLRDLKLIYEIINEDILNFQSSDININRIDAIFLFYSLTQESNTLKADLDKIKFFFGNLDNLILILTKSKVLSKEKELMIKNISSTYNLTDFVHLTSSCEKGISTHTKGLLMSRINNYLTTYSLENIKTRIYNINNSIKAYGENSQIKTSLSNGLIYLYKEVEFSHIDLELHKYDTIKYIFYTFFTFFSGIIIFLLKRRKKIEITTTSSPENDHSSELEPENKTNTSDNNSNIYETGSDKLDQNNTHKVPLNIELSKTNPVEIVK